MVEIELTVSKIETDNFLYTGLDISIVSDRINIKMKDYVESVQDVKGNQESRQGQRPHQTRD